MGFFHVIQLVDIIPVFENINILKISWRVK